MRKYGTFLMTFLFFCSLTAQAGRYYWVGNGGTWTDVATHWATTSGGSTMHTHVPGANDTVYFDNNSFSQHGQSVIIDTLLAECSRFVWNNNQTKAYVFSGVNDTLRIHGSCLLSDSVMFHFSGHLDIIAPAPVIAVLNFGHNNLQCHIRLAADSAVLASPMYLPNNNIYIRDGSLFTNGYNITCKHFNADSTLTGTLPVASPAWYSYDTLFIWGSMALAPSLAFHQYGPVYFYFNSLDKNYINAYSNTFPGNVIFKGSKKMYLQSPLHIDGNLEYAGGGSFFSKGNTITADRLISTSSLPRMLHFSSSILHLMAADSALKLQSNGLTLIADTADVYFDYAGPDTVSIASGKDVTARFRRIYLPATYTLIYNSLWTSLLDLGAGSNIALARGTTLTAGTIQSSSDCEVYNYLRAFCSSCPDCGDGDPCDTLRPVLSTSAVNTIEFLKLRNLRHTGASLTANKSFNEGNVSGITINEPLTADTLYWVQGSGKWDDPGHWAQTSGGAPNLSCLPNRHTNVVFDNASFPSQSDITIPENAYCHDITCTNTIFTGTLSGNGTLVIGGNIILNDRVHLSPDGGLLLESSATDTNTITTRGANLACDMLIKGVNSWLLTDTLFLNGKLTLNSGKLLLNKNDLRCNAFLSDGDLSRTLNYSYSTIFLNGSDTTWRSSGSNLTLADTAASIRILGSGADFIIMDAGNRSFDTLDIRAASVRIADSIAGCSLLKVAPGVTVEFEPLRTIHFDSIAATGSCQQPITLAAYSTSTDAVLFRCTTAKDSIVVSDVILRNLCADTIGKRKYTAVNSTGLGKTTGWVIPSTGSGKKYFWTGLASTLWHQAGNWEYNSDTATCIPGPKDTVIFEKTRLAAPGSHDTIVIPKSAYCGTMIWRDSIAGSPRIQLGANLFCSGSVQLCDSLTLAYTSDFQASHENAPQIIFQPDNNKATLDPVCDTFGVNLSLQAVHSTDTLLLTGHLKTGLQNKVSILSGTFMAGSRNINTGILETSGDRQKNINLSKSNINITYAFLMQSRSLLHLTMDSSYLVLDDNFLYHNIFDGGGHRYDTIEFKSRPTGYTQVKYYADIQSSDTVNLLKINPGLHVRLTSGITQVFDSLLVSGSCTDSISLLTTAPGSPAGLRDMSGDTIRGLCLSVKDISAFPTALAIYSTNRGGNSNWIFSNRKLSNAGFTFTEPNCFGDSIHFQNTTTALSGDITDLAFQWVFGDNDTSYNVAPVHYYSGSNDYYLSLTSTDTATRCQDIFHDTITVRKPNIQLLVSFADGISDYRICKGDSITLTAMSNNLNPSFSFVLGNDTLAPVTDSVLITSQIASGDEVFVIVNDFGCKAASNQFVITVDELPVLNLSCGDPDTAVCSGENLTLSASGADLYELYLNGGIADSLSGTNHWNIAAPTDQDYYTVFGRNNLTGCSNFGTDTLTITVHPTPLVSFSSSEPDLTLCYGDPVSMTASGALYYQFFFNGNPYGDTTFNSLLNPGIINDGDIFSVTGTSTDGCLATSTELEYQVNPTPHVILTTSEPDEMICQGQSVTFQALGAVTYQFFLNGDSVAASGPGLLTTTSLQNGQVISVSGTLGNCSAMADSTYTMTVHPNITWSYSNPVICADDTIHIVAHGDTQYLFSIDNVPQGTAGPDSAFDAIGLTNGQIITVSGSAGACLPSGLSAVVHPLPVPVFTCSEADTTLCEGDQITFTASGGDEYAFYLNGLPLTTPNGINIYSTDSLTNGETIGLMAESSFGCTAVSENSYTVAVRPYPIPGLVCSEADLAICTGDTVTFTATGADLYEFFVSGASQGTASGDSIFMTTGLTTGATVTVAGSRGQCTAIADTSIQITVNSYPILDFYPMSPLSYCAGDTLKLIATGATTYQFFVDGTPEGAPSGMNIFTSATLNDGQSITVTGTKNSCSIQADTSYTVDVNVYPVLTFSNNLSGTSLCYGDTILFSGGGAASYIFYLDGIPVSYDNNYQTSDLEQGQTVTLQGGNGACWLYADTVFTIPIHQMNLQITCTNPAASLCAGGLASFTASGADLYEFFVDGISQGAAGTNAVFSTPSLTNGQTVSVSGTSTTTSCTQTAAANYYLHVFPVPSIVATPGTPVCEGDSVLLETSSEGTLSWYLNNDLVPGVTAEQFYTTEAGNWTVVASQGGEDICLSAGANNAGQLGNNSLTNSLAFKEANALTQVSSVACGDEFTLALRENGEVYGWGRNEFGALGTGNFTNAIVPVSCGGIVDAQAISAGGRHSIALLNDSTVLSWGDNTYGQLGLGHYFTSNFPTTIPGLNNIVAVASGNAFNLALNASGEVYVWGRNQYGQLGDGTETTRSTPVLVAGLHDVVAIRAGANHSLALKADGSLWAWGGNNTGQLGTGDLIGRSNPVRVELPIGLISFDGGLEHTIVADSAGHVYTWGGNSFGQIGDNSTQTRLYPVRINSAGQATMVRAGQYASYAVRHDQNVFSWGMNQEGQLGQGHTNTVLSPAPATELFSIYQLDAGTSHMAVIPGMAHQCASLPAEVQINPVPAVSIALSGLSLYTLISGDSYQWYYNGNPIPGANDSVLLITTHGIYQLEVTFSNGCSAMSNPYDYFSDVEEDPGAWHCLLYPNPGNGNFTILIDPLNTPETHANIRVMNVTGQVVFQGRFGIQNHLIPVSLTDLAPGVYEIGIYCGDMAIRKTLVIQ